MGLLQGPVLGKMASWLVFLGLGFCVCANHGTSSGKTTSICEDHRGGGFVPCPLIKDLNISYDPDHPYGPPKWPEISCCCGGEYQSPIDIPLSKVKPRCFKPLQFKTRGCQESELKNNGRTVTWQGLKGVTQVRNIPHMGCDTFTLYEVHIHWGANGTLSSEHRIDGSGYTADIHAVFYNNKYCSFQTAQKNEDGLVVFSILVQEGPMTTNAALKKMLDQVLQVKQPEEKSEVHFRPLDLLPRQRDFITYKGSLTTPPCTENVRWVIFISPHIASHSQMAQLRKVCNAHGDLVSKFSNRRPTKPIRGRPIESNACFPGLKKHH